MIGLIPDGWFLAAEPPKPADAGGPSVLTFLAVVLVVFILPFVLGTLLAKMWRVREMGFRLGVVLFAGAIGFAPFVWQYVRGAREQAAWPAIHAAWEKDGKAEGKPEPQPPEPRTWKSAIKLGIDLEGGTNLVFEVDEKQTQGKEITSEVMAQMVAAVSRRINPTGTEEVVVRAVGKNRLEVIVPGAKPEDVERIKGQITRLGSLEFAILANESDHREQILRAEGAKRDVTDAQGRVVASWREIADGADGKPKYQPSGSDVVRTIKEKGKDVAQVLIVLDKDPAQRVTGRYLTRAYETTDESGGIAVGFSFNARGALLFQQLTSRNTPRADGSTRHLAVLLDERIHTAPSIRSTISDSGQITGNYTRDEVNELIGVLRAGALEVPLKHNPVSEFSVGPLLAHDVQEKGMMSVYVSTALVVVFMLVYYMFAGVVADVCLVMNVVLVLGAMAYIDATFTLPGIAGIVLTIGMAVDANVLIYERMREEQARGSSLRMTIQNGFGKALSAIVDSNVTTLITAVILYMIGTDQIKGFAVTLFIGLTASMFTAVFMGRVIFELFERKRWITSLRMMGLIKVPSIDWLAWFRPAMGLSAVVILAGMIALFARGRDNLDIDFTGGTVVTIEFEKEQDIVKVQQTLQTPEALGTSTSVERLAILGQDTTASDLGTQFRIRTKEQDFKKVSEQVEQTLSAAGMALRKVTLDTIGEIVDLSAPDAKPSGLVEFPKGREVTLTFSSGLKTATVEDYLEEAVRSVKGAGGKTFEQPKALFTVTGAEKAPAGADSFTSVRVNSSAELPEDVLKSGLAAMQNRMASRPVFTEVNTFDSQVAGEMQEMALIAIFFSILVIVGYIWFRFERVTWGIAAVAALGHDVLVTLGAIPLAAYLSQTPVGRALGLDDFKINLGVVASILTIIGYSLNDTIVIFDRIREIRGKNPALTAEMLNASVNQTLSRSILTAFTVLVVVIIMYLFGGEGLHAFAFTMIIGVLSGSWSTIYMSNPVLYWLMNRPGSTTAKATGAMLRTAKTAAG